MGRPSAASPRRRPRVLYLLVCMAMIGVMLALAACGSKSGTTSSSASTAPTANILAIADTGVITTWDPRASGSSETRILANFYEPLIWAKTRPAARSPTRPALATSWETSSAGRFGPSNCGTGSLFTTARRSTPRAVKYSYNATRNSVWPRLHMGRSQAIKVVDSYTVQLILDKPFPLERWSRSEYAAWIFRPEDCR